jgi:hypothetical protein
MFHRIVIALALGVAGSAAGDFGKAVAGRRLSETVPYEEMSCNGTDLHRFDSRLGCCEDLDPTDLATFLESQGCTNSTVTDATSFCDGAASKMVASVALLTTIEVSSNTCMHVEGGGTVATFEVLGSNSKIKVDSGATVNIIEVKSGADNTLIKVEAGSNAFGGSVGGNTDNTRIFNDATTGGVNGAGSLSFDVMAGATNVYCNDDLLIAPPGQAFCTSSGWIGFDLT